MSKENLKFKITGKTVAYEGRPHTRAKDLMDIAVRMEVDQSDIVYTFRRNIEDHANYTDEKIIELFILAQKAYAAKKKRKSGAGSVPTVPSDDQEKPQKLTLTFKGKQFSYEGLLSNKQRAVIELLIQQSDLTMKLAIITFRINLPESTATDDEIWTMIMEAKEAKAARKAAKIKEAGGEPSVPPLQPPLPGQAVPSEYRLRSAGGSADITGIDAIDEIVGMSLEERESISKFIKQVLEEPDMDLTLRLRDDTTLNSARNPILLGGSVGGGGGGGGDDDSLLMTARTTRGKIAIYCQEENSSANKVLYIAPSTTFEEFSAMVEKKFERKMALAFYEGEDIIDMDDDDVFCMFLEASQQQNQEGKRMKLVCIPPEARRKAADDKLTDDKATDSKKVNSLQDAKSYSNGTLLMKEERTFTSHTSAVYCCSFSINGDHFCTASRDRSVRMWNSLTGSSSVMKGGHNGFVLSCDFSPRGNRIVSSSDDSTIKIWNTATLSKVFTLKGHDDKVYCVQYNSTGEYIVSASCDHTLRVWNADTGVKITTLRGHSLAIFSCCFSNTDAGRYVVSGGDDRVVKVWEWSKNEEVRCLGGHTDTIWSCKFSHDDTSIVTATMNHELKIWDWKSGTCARNLFGHQVPIHHAIFSPDDKYVFSCARDWTVMVWVAKTGEHIETISGHHSTVYHIDIHGNKLLTSSLDNTLKMWDITELRKDNDGKKN